MATARRNERRLLNDQEFELVEKTHHPAIADVADDELSQLVSHLRERRNRARDIANKQRRAVRGKGAGTSNYDKADEGNRQKQSVLAAALQRLNKESKRRSVKSARKDLVGNARRALELRDAAPKAKRPSSKTANKGMRANPNEKAEAIGSPMEAGRVSQAVKKAQARRDSR